MGLMPGYTLVIEVWQDRVRDDAYYVTERKRPVDPEVQAAKRQGIEERKSFVKTIQDHAIYGLIAGRFMSVFA